MPPHYFDDYRKCYQCRQWSYVGNGLCLNPGCSRSLARASSSTSDVHVQPPLRRVAEDGNSYTETEFANWYGASYRDIWNQASASHEETMDSQTPPSMPSSSTSNVIGASTHNANVAHGCGIAISNLHDFVFSLKDRGSSCCAKKVVVLPGVTKAYLHERHDPPLKGKRIELAVWSKADILSSRGTGSVDVVADCHNFIGGHLAGSGGIKAYHDGRNFHLLDAVPTRYTEEFVRTFVDLVVAALQTDQKSCRCTLSCKKGRHRSVASAYWFAVILTILGAEVIVHIPSARLCPCETCDACTYVLLAKHWDTWCIDIQESAIEYIKSHCSDMTIVRDGLVKTIEFLEYCEIGL